MCNYCETPESHSIYSKEFGDMCGKCYAQIFGKSLSPESYDRKFENGDLVVWIKDEKIVRAWFDDGSTAIPESVYDGTQIVDSIKKLLVFRKTGQVWCSSCAKAFPQDKIVHSHFAGRFCADCFKDYQKKNSQVCLLCHSPYWDCCC